MAQMVKNMLVKQETQVRYLSWDNPLDKRMTTHSSIAGKILWTQEPGGLQPMESQS